MEQQTPSGDADAEFGWRLRHLREQAGLTQQQLAGVMRAAGSKMHRSTIGKIEAGERVVSVGEAAQFADVLGIGLTQLITMRDSRPLPTQETRIQQIQRLLRIQDGINRLARETSQLVEEIVRDLPLPEGVSYITTDSVVLKEGEAGQ